MIACADELQVVSDKLVHWAVYDPAVKCEIGSIAVRVASGLVVVDPVPLAGEAWSELVAESPLRAILLTNGNHVRNADALRQKYQVPIVTGIAAHKEIAPLRPDVILFENELLYGATAISIPGATAGETAFLFAEGILALGDAVINVDSEKASSYCRINIATTRARTGFARHAARARFSYAHLRPRPAHDHSCAGQPARTSRLLIL